MEYNEAKITLTHNSGKKVDIIDNLGKRLLYYIDIID